MTAEQIREFNGKHVGRAFVVSTQTQTHFMHGETLCIMLEQLYSVAFKEQRTRKLCLQTALPYLPENDPFKKVDDIYL